MNEMKIVQLCVEPENAAFCCSIVCELHKFNCIKE
jgi:hypothetical protein